MVSRSPKQGVKPIVRCVSRILSKCWNFSIAENKPLSSRTPSVITIRSDIRVECKQSGGASIRVSATARVGRNHKKQKKCGLHVLV